MQLQFNSDIIELLDGYTNANLDPRPSNYDVGWKVELLIKKKKGWNVEPNRAVTTAQAPAKPLV